jgi:cell division protein ZapA (FtsZ GTPase activity inhibitor)
MYSSVKQVDRLGIMDEKLSIRINIADRYYPLKIDRNDEERIRKAARHINEKVIQYKQRYSDKDTQDFLAMAALQFVLKSIDSEGKGDISPILEKIREINHELDSVINRE